jgi:hypothetical protein
VESVVASQMLYSLWCSWVDHDYMTCPPQLTHRDIAALAGTVWELIGKTLRDFAHKGIISLDGRRIVITDVETLRDVATLRERESCDVWLWNQKADISNLKQQSCCQSDGWGIHLMETESCRVS